MADTQPDLVAMYIRALNENPIPMQLMTAAILALAADALAQRREGVHPFDLRRAAAFVVVEAAFRGYMQQPILQWMDAHIHGDWLGAMWPWFTPNIAAALERAIFNQLTVSPFVYFPMYWLITGVLQGLTLAVTVERMRSQYFRIFGRSVLFWLPVSFVQFAYVQGYSMRIVFMSTAGLVWNVCLSLMAGSVRLWEARKDAGADAAADETAPRRRGKAARVAPVSRGKRALTEQL